MTSVIREQAGMTSDWDKFKQSNIARILIGYAVVVFAFMQIFDYLLPVIEAPLWVAQTLTLLLFLGFPVSLLVGWVTQNSATHSERRFSADESKPLYSMPRQKLVLIGVGSSVIFGFLGLVLMPYMLGRAQLPNEEGNFLDGSSAAFSSLSPKLDLFLGETSTHPARGFRTEISLSPNGKMLAYLVNLPTSVETYIRDLESREPARLLTTANRGAGVGRLMFSPDGEWINYLDDAALVRVSVSGGTSQKIHNSISFMSGFSLFGSDQILFTDASRRLISGSIVSSTIQVFESEDSYLEWPSFMPGGTHALVTRVEKGGSAKDGAIEILNLETLETTAIIENAFNAKYVPTGHIVFARGSSLWAVPFNLSELSVVGDQVPVVLAMETNGNEGTAIYTFSETGRLIYLEGFDVSTEIAGSRISEVNREGIVRNLEIPNLDYGQVDISQNEGNLALTIYDGPESDIWIIDTEVETLERKTFDGKSLRPVWANEEMIYYYSKGEGIKALAADGTGQSTIVFPTDVEALPTSVSSDGDIVFSMGSPLKLFSFNPTNLGSQEFLADELDITPIVHSWHGSQISPDGKWIAYASEETGERHVFVRPYPNLTQGKWQASAEPGFMPLWSKRNQELYYWSEDHRQYAIPYEIFNTNLDQEAMRFSSPNELFAIRGMRGNKLINTWATDPDSNFFMVLFPEEAIITAEQVLENQTILTVVENWFDELKELAPANIQ